jgi:hypothetical protein
MPDARLRTTSGGDTPMRFMIPLKPNEDTEAGVLKRTVTDGPFTEAKELIVGLAAKR